MTEATGTVPKPLHHIFTAVPRSYNLINRVITLGMDKGWRLAAAREILSIKPQKILDLGCGTGDLTIELARLSQERISLTGFDYSQPMLDIAQKREQSLSHDKQISFVYGEASNLPFPDDYFDCIGISFAFRNLTYRNPLANSYLAEVLRVLRPGGNFVIIESSQPKLPVIRWFFHVYLRWFVFPAGYILSGNRGAYNYLSLSAMRFYTAEEVVKLLLNCGFSRVRFRRFMLGATALHTAVK